MHDYLHVETVLYTRLSLLQTHVHIYTQNYMYIYLHVSRARPILSNAPCSGIFTKVITYSPIQINNFLLNMIIQLLRETHKNVPLNRKLTLAQRLQKV